MKYIDYLPEVLKGIKEFDALGKALDGQFEAVSDKAGQTLKEPIAVTATQTGLERFEKLLGLSGVGKTVEQRRQAVASKLVCAPFTENWLLQKLKAKCGEHGADVYLERDKYLVCVELFMQDEKALQETYDELLEVIPANMVLCVKQGERGSAYLNFTATVTVADIIDYKQQ